MTKYYLVISSKYTIDIGDIFSVRENETIENVLKTKLLTKNDIFELSVLEYKYYETINRNLRIQRHKKNIFKDISELTQGNKCRLRMKNINLTVQIVKKENQSNGIRFKCKKENGEYCDIPASSIEEIIILNQGDDQSRSGSTETNKAGNDHGAEAVIENGFYMLSIKVVNLDAGSIIQSHNGTVKLLENSYTFMNHDLIKDHLIKLEKDEAIFLHKFPIDKRIKKHKRQDFEMMTGLQINQECYLRSDKYPRTSFIITGKNVESDLIKFNLTEKRNSSIIKQGVAASDIKLPKTIWNTIADSASSINRQISRKSDSSNESIHAPRNSSKMREIEETLCCKIIDLKVINPDAIRNVDIKDQTKFNKLIVISNNKKERFIIQLLWKGLIDYQICLGCELLQDWDCGTNGEFIGQKLFDCKRKRGILIPLNEDMDSCESKYRSDHKSLKSNEIIEEDRICCVEFKDKNELSDHKIYRTNIFGKAIKKKDVEWTGLVNGKECVGVIWNNKDYQGRYKKNWIIDVLKLSKLALIQMGDIHIEFIDHIYVANMNDVSNFEIVKRNDNYKIEQLVQVGIFYGKVEFFVDQFELVGIILDDEQIHKNHEFLQNILFKDQILNQPGQFILVKIDDVQDFISEFHFKNESCVINEISIKYKSQSRSTKFKINEIVKSNNKGLSKYFRVQNFWNLNGVQCLSVTKAISLDENVEHEYLREIDICTIGEIKTEYFLETFIKPTSIVTFEKSSHGDLKANDDVEFKSRISDVSFQGTIKMIIKANGILSGIIELKNQVESDLLKNESINKSGDLCNLFDGNYIVPADLLRKLQDKLEEKNNICVINPQSVNSLKGKAVKEKYIIFECDGKQCWALLKWKGIINNSRNCLGCDIEIKSNFGTNGTFGNQSIFKCDDGCGVLIPVDKIDNCCVTVAHRKLSINNNRIDEKTICCIKPTNVSKLNPKININERIRKTNGKETGIFKWVGIVNKEEIIGLDSKNIDKEGTDGTFCGVRLFKCNAKCGALFESKYFENELKRIEDIGVNVIDPFNIKSIENGSKEEIKKIMYVNRKMGKQIIIIKWRGLINGNLCVGCELANMWEYGTDGTFDGQKLFNCGDRKGILIPIDVLVEGCESENHKSISKFDGIHNRFFGHIKSINPEYICCVERSTNIKTWPELQIDSRVKYKNQDSCGTCKWIGLVNGKEAVGVEMDNECKGTNGRFSSFDLFTCNDGRGHLFTADDIEHDKDCEKVHFIFDKIVDTNKIFIVRPFNENKIFENNPAMIEIDNKIHIGEVKWMGIINKEKCVGLDMEDQFEYGMDGIVRNVIRFVCKIGHGLITTLANVKLYEDGLNYPQFLIDGLINPNKYLRSKENWNNEFLKEKNIKKDNFVFVKLKNESTETKMKGTLKWCGFMNKLPVGIVELTRDHEYGTNGMFWRTQLLKCPEQRAIAVSWNNIYEYFPYVHKEIPKEDRIFPEIDINSAVKYYVGLNNYVKELFGTVKWTGVDEDGKYFYGLELDDRIPDGTDGLFSGQRLFQCRPGHGILASINNIAKDTRFTEEEMTPDEIPSSKDSEEIYHGALAKLIPGPNRGIQGNANSCYFDSAIFALFSTSDVLDYMISPTLNELEINDITKEFRNIISWKIIYPLREFGFVSFHKTNEMRNVIKKYGPKFEEMVTQESDMENVSKLLSKLCPDEQLLSMISFDNCKSNSMFLQLFLILERKLEFMSSEEMLKLSMVQNNIMFNELPSCLIMQAPRDAKGNNCYQYVLPNDFIEISDICSNYVKICSKCSNEARFLCKKCIDNYKPEISNCYMCVEHKCHHGDVIKIPRSTTKSKSKVFMELKAIICIEKCHFVAYVKQAEMIKKIKSTVKENRWYFFDSMSTQSSSNNYAVPKVTFSEEVSHFLNMSPDQMKQDIKGYGMDNIKRIVLDSYIFVYHNPAKTCY